MSLQIANTTRRALDEARLEKAVDAVLTAEGCSLFEIGAVYCGNRMIRRLNREYLQHDYATDTITFSFGEGPEIEGEFYISLDVVEENARRFGTTFDDELMRVTIHSALHLAGYGDSSEEERRMMVLKEDHYLGLVKEV
jgi:probable rRNA maturation factor